MHVVWLVAALVGGGCKPTEELVFLDSAVVDDAAAARDLATFPPDATSVVDAATPPDLAMELPDLGPPPDLAVVLVDTRLRIVAANLTSGNSQSYQQPGINILQGLKPDVVVIQEFNVPNADRRAFVDTTFGTGFDYYVGTGAIPNGVISRYHIVDQGEWIDTLATNRAFAWARIDVPGPIDLWAVSVHLLTSSSTARSNEATQLVAYITAAVPSGDYLVIGGDFNTEDATEPALADLSSTVVVMPPFPVDQAGISFTSGNRTKQYDWVLVTPELDALQTPVAIGAATYPYGLVFDSRVYTPLTDVPPVLITDSAATNMQHMAVVRDFLLSAPAGD